MAEVPEPDPQSVLEQVARADEALAQARRELEQEWRGRLEVQGLFDLVLDAMPDAVVLVDGRGHISSANQAAAAMAGRPVEDLIGRAARSVFGERAPRTPWEVFDRAPDGRV